MDGEVRHEVPSAAHLPCIRVLREVHFLPVGSAPGSRKKMLMQGLVLDRTKIASVDLAKLLVAGFVVYCDAPHPEAQL